MKGVPYYIGGLYFCLRIGGLPGIREDLPSDGIRFIVPMREWKRLKGGEPMWLTWGEPAAYEKITPFARLDKKMLKKR